MVTVFGLSGLNWNVILPVYSTQVFGGDASQYGLLVGILGVGAMTGGLIVARVTTISGGHFRNVGILMAVAFGITAVAPSLPVAIVGLALLGAAATSFQIFAQTRLQLEADDLFSGRILAIYSVALVGTKPIGGVLVGVLMDAAGGLVAFAVCGAIAALMFSVCPVAGVTPPRRPGRPRSPWGQPGCRAGDAAARSEVGRSAVHVQRLAGDEAGILAEQEEAGIGDLVRSPEAPQRQPVGPGHRRWVPGRVASRVDPAG
jgi:MFS family permease